MTIKQRAEEFARKHLDFDDGLHVDPKTIEACIKMYELVARDWAEKGYEQGYKREARDWSKLDAMGNIVNSGFAQWWKEVGGE